MKFRKLLLLVLLGTLGTLSAMAYASPPDQSWLGGLFDDDDDDDVILLITSSSAVVNPFLLATCFSPPPLIASALPTEGARLATRALRGRAARAPPFA